MSEVRRRVDDGRFGEELVVLELQGECGPCPYLPGRTACHDAYVVNRLSPEQYEALMHAGFRRSGRLVYRTNCPRCEACRPIRVLVNAFSETKSMSRVRRRNADVSVDVIRPVATPEKFELFRRYLDAQHDGTMTRTYEAFQQFLYASPIATREFLYHAAGRLVGVSIADVCPTGLSSVYMYFDPDEARRSLGTFSVLHEIDHSRSRGLPYYYLGYWVDGSVTMDYKNRFRPNEILTPEGAWTPFRQQ